MMQSLAMQVIEKKHPNSILVRKSSQLRDCYSAKFLLNELYPAACRMTDAEFARYHVYCLNHLIEGININSFSVTIQEFRDDENSIDIIYKKSINIYEIHYEVYKKFSCLDFVKNYSFNNVGCAVFNTDFMPLNKWLDNEMYEVIKKPYGVHNSVQIMYKIPFWSRKRFKIIYHTKFPDRFDPAITSDEIEYVTLPLFLSWLIRSKICDAEVVLDWLKLLVGTTPRRLSLLREIVNIGRYQIGAIAVRLNISERAVNNCLAEAYGTISHLIPVPELADKHASQIVDLVRYYQFLRMVGSPRYDGNIRVQISDMYKAKLYH